MKAKPVKFEQCGHPAEAVTLGPRVPLAFGSSACEVCSRCGGHRLLFREGIEWTKGPPDLTDRDRE